MIMSLICDQHVTYAYKKQRKMHAGNTEHYIVIIV